MEKWGRIETGSFLKSTDRCMAESADPQLHAVVHVLQLVFRWLVVPLLAPALILFFCSSAKVVMKLVNFRFSIFNLFFMVSPSLCTQQVYADR